ncbi:protein HP-25 homolog 1-like [Mya arenaria]|uniref:protein HP-25 homolog 1-like n=1 Tax=Mya arenaria TaxID=6604 RepID=UPI0022E590C7|nr:protein HP-25 homolog 1-like [Mya arenaria]
MAGHGLCFLLDDNSLQNLISLISTEKKMRAQVEADLLVLQQSVQNLRNGHMDNLCNCPSMGVVAFSATITKDVTNFGSHQPLVFDKVITNVGGAYDSRHGTFRAPVDGIYQFSFSALQGTSTMWLGLELVRDGVVIGRVKTGDNGYYNQGTNVINARLKATNDVWVRHMTDSDNKHVVADGGYFTSFSGHLIATE